MDPGGHHAALALGAALRNRCLDAGWGREVCAPDADNPGVAPPVVGVAAGLDG